MPKDYHRLTHQRGRERFFNANCWKCKMENDCVIKEYIAEGRDLTETELQDYFGLVEIDANSVCDKMVPVDGEEEVVNESPVLF